MGDLGSILRLGRSPREGKGYPLQFSGLENSNDCISPCGHTGGGYGNLLQYSYLENPHGQRSLASYGPWGRKEWDTTEQLSIAHSTVTVTKWKETHRGREQNNVSGKKEWGRGKRWVGDSEIQTAMYKINELQGYIVQHGEYSQHIRITIKEV